MNIISHKTTALNTVKYQLDVRVQLLLVSKTYGDKLIVLQLDDLADDDRLPASFHQLTTTKHPRLTIVHLVVAQMSPLKQSLNQ